MSVLKIDIPSARNDSPAKGVCPTFIASGTVPVTVQGSDGKSYPVKTVKGYVYLYRDGQLGSEPIAVGKLLGLRPDRQPGLLRWIILFESVVSTPQRVRVTIQAVGKPPEAFEIKSSVDVYVQELLRYLPSFDWPPENYYTLSGDELGTFMVAGPSDYPIISLTLNGAGAVYYEWSNDDDFWWGYFENLSTTPGPGTWLLEVTSTQATNSPAEYIVIPAIEPNVKKPG